MNQCYLDLWGFFINRFFVVEHFQTTMYLGLSTVHYISPGIVPCYWDVVIVYVSVHSS